MARKNLQCAILYQESQIIKEWRSTRVHENHCKRLYGRCFSKMKLPC